VQEMNIKKIMNSVYVVVSSFYQRFLDYLLDCHKIQTVYICIVNDNMTAVKWKPYKHHAL
jgi:hypothetical protein